jgi:3-dehydroquinate synthase
VAGVSRLIIGEPLTRLPRVLAQEARKNAKVMVVADSAVKGRYGQSLRAGLAKAGFDAHLLAIPSGERSKTLAQAGSLYRALARAKFERGSWLIALGGGVVGDLTGFVAATFLRGISYIQAPTTLLAQVDAAIGGKTGVDILEGKNLVGAFYHPRFVWIDPTVLKTLPLRHWRNGLAEVIKYGAIWDNMFFKRLEHLLSRPVKGYTPEWAPVIARCAQIKAAVVAKDPAETKGVRAILNFGHSVGHAIEAAADYRDYLHGEAIAIGMAVAGKLSEELSGLKGVERMRLMALLSKAGLPTRLRRPIKRARILEFLARDKKVENGAVRFVLLKGLGKAVSGQAVPPEFLASALAEVGL